VSRRPSRRAPVTADQLTDHLRALWSTYRTLHPRGAHPALRVQTTRARAAVLSAIAETQALQDALHIPGPIDLDRELTDTPMSGDQL
jgi:hypothetical protein